MINPDLSKWTRVLIYCGRVCRMTGQRTADQLMDHNLAISDHLYSTKAFLHYQNADVLAHNWYATGSVYLIQWATVLSLWEYFILLFWTKLLLHIFSLTFEHVHCLTSLLNMVWKQWSSCSIVCTIGSNTFWLLQCTSVNSRSLSESRPAKLSFLTQLICKHNLHCQKCYRISCSQLAIEKLIICKQLITFSTILADALPVNNIECKNAIHRK